MKVAAIAVTPIGIIRSRFDDVDGVPIQSAAAPQEPGEVHVYDSFAAGLSDIEEFEFLLLITHLHRSTIERLEVVPFLDDESHGVFATRAPVRPNHLGLSLVRLVRRNANVLEFTGCDMVDGTPVLDIKPYVPVFDSRDTSRIGWFAKNIERVASARADDRMK